MRIKVIAIVLLLVLSAGVTVHNRDYWERRFSGGPEAPPPASPSDREVPEPPVARARAGSSEEPASEEPGEAPGAGHQEPGGSLPPRELATPGPWSGLVQALKERLEAAPPGDPSRAAPAPFHHPAELVAGLSLEDLLHQALQARKAAPGPGGAGGVPEGAEKTPPGPREGGLREAVLRGVLQGPDRTVCVIGDHRLQPGDPYPGSDYVLETVGPRKVVFRSGEHRITCHLGGGTSTPGPGVQGGRREDKPEEEDEESPEGEAGKRTG